MKHRLSGLTFITIILNVGVARSQGPQLVNVVPPSPNVQALQQYGDIPVSPYTGVPNISIPLYTIKFRDITIPITISYHASGIKVAEEAGEVGLGWVLNAGGVISRTVVGDDDFDGNNYFNPSIINLSDGLGPTRNLQTGTTNLEIFNKSIPNLPTIIDTNLASYISNGMLYDFQPDQFYYNFQGHSGRFILRRDRSAVLEKQEKIQITCLSSDGSSWEIQTEDGYSYIFSQYETYIDNVHSQTHKSAWYLTKIISPSGNQVIFNYTINAQYVKTIGGYSETREDYTSGMITPVGVFSGVSYGNQQGPTPGMNYTIVTLSSIDFTNGLVNFSYSANRADLQGDKRLDSIQVYKKDISGNIEAIPFRTISFNYGYFMGQLQGTGPYDSISYARLKLTGINIKGTLNGLTSFVSPYTFDYYDTPINNVLPIKNSFARDHWGYFNGKLSNSSLIPSFTQFNIPTAFAASTIGVMGPERNADTNYVKAFSLKDIFYPTGGSSTFQYESNDFDVAASEVNDNSFFGNEPVLSTVDTALSYDGSNRGVIHIDTLNLIDEYSYPASVMNPSSPSVTVNAAFRFIGGTGGNCNDVNIGSMQVYYELDDITGKEIDIVDPGGLTLCSSNNNAPPCIGCQTGSPVFTYTNTYHLTPGKYLWKTYAAGSGNALKLEDIHATFTWYIQSGTQATGSSTSNTFGYAVGGGIRISRIIDQDAMGNSKEERFLYHYFADKNHDGTPEEYSYGRMMVMPRYSYFDISTDTYQGGVIPTAYIGPIYHLIRSSDSNIPLFGGGGGTTIGYDQVTEMYGENGENGKTIFQYDNEPNTIYSYMINGLPMRPPYESGLSHWDNGNLLLQQEYKNQNGQFIKVRDIIHSYDINPAMENFVYGIDNRPEKFRTITVNSQGQESASQSSPLPNEVDLYCFTSLASEWSFPSQTTENVYDPDNSGKFLSSTTTYSYNNPNHMQPTQVITTNSKGERIITNMQYPLDFTNLNNSNNPIAQGIQNLQNNHLINPIIEKYIQKSNADGSNLRTVSAILNTYKPTIPLPDTIYDWEATGPVTNFSPATITSSSITKDANYSPLIAFDAYDNYGNILQQHKVNDVSHSYIWDYNSSYPIAEAVNATQADIAYTSFEADGTGNWTFSDTTRDRAYAITGTQSYDLGGGKTIVKNGLNTTRSYIVSYWSRNGAVNVNGITATAGLTKNGWNYYEHKLPAGSSSVTVLGSATIDELRLYPADAQMTTYTYDPLIGMTSQCSVNNIITYYDYDGLGRLQDIKDQDGNIVKTFEYNYKH